MASDKSISTHPLFKDITGQRFGRLVVQQYAGSDKHGKAHWLCLCDCGKTATINGSSMRVGNAGSCGCMEGCRKHGKSRDAIYNSWAMMKDRCNNPKSTQYDCYGKRGIKVCRGWTEDFAAFFNDMGSRPQEKTLDRIDNNANYSCGKCAECIDNNWPPNCRWATKAEQERNKRTNVFLTCQGRTQILKDWATEMGADPMVLHSRLKRWGGDVERAILTPVIHRTKRKGSNHGK